MRRELTHVLISLVLMIVIWAITLLGGAQRNGSAIGLLLLIGSIWATVDFLVALWRLFRARSADDDDPEDAAF